MKAYVIKNKEGKMLCWHYACGYYFDHFNYRSLSYMEIGTEKEIKFTLNNKEFDNKDCKIVEITIEETNTQNQKAIECLKELKEKLKRHCDYCFTVDDTKGWYLSETKIDLLIDNKIKELEKNND